MTANFFGKIFNLFLSLFWCAISQSFGQETINIDGVNCNSHGSSCSNQKEYTLNQYKNRYRFPVKADYLQGISIFDLAGSTNYFQFPQNKAVAIRGYVLNVKAGGIESCNCKTKNPIYKDTHIILVPDAWHTAPQYRIIVEVTPRIRAIMKINGVDWSTEALEKLLTGHYINVAGWLFYDVEHQNQAFANNPKNKRDWRASCWEIHPITSIKIIKSKGNPS
jgi:hypothetical protein